MIDMWSRYSVSTFIRSMQSSYIIDGIMERWVIVFGVMRAIMFEDLDEFNSDEVREVAYLNIKPLIHHGSKELVAHASRIQIALVKDILL